MKSNSVSSKLKATVWVKIDIKAFTPIWIMSGSQVGATRAEAANTADTPMTQTNTSVRKYMRKIPIWIWIMTWINSLRSWILVTWKKSHFLSRRQNHLCREKGFLETRLIPVGGYLTVPSCWWFTFKYPISVISSMQACRARCDFKLLLLFAYLVCLINIKTHKQVFYWRIKNWGNGEGYHRVDVSSVMFNQCLINKFPLSSLDSCQTVLRQ